jgi:hypothetical protein
MKKLLAISALFLSALSFGQAFTEGFNDLQDASATSKLTPLNTRGWLDLNMSKGTVTFAATNGLGNTGWFGNGIAFSSHTGAGYVSANYENVAGTGTISNWLMSPVVTLHNGDTFSYWTRTATGVHPDRLEVRLSQNGNSTNVGLSETTVGDFTTVLDTVNPNQLTGAANYPTTWTLHTITLSGISGTPSGRFAFRYFVTTAGLGAANGEYIGIDDVTYTPNLAKTVSGTLTLSSYTGALLPGTSFVFEIRDASTNALLETDPGTITAGFNFTLSTNLAAGNYKLRIKGVNRFLAKSLPVTLSGTGASGLAYTLTNGDANGDNVVGTADFNLLRAAFGGAAPNPPYSEACDFNGDGIIGTADFNIMKASFGQAGDN